MRQLNDRQNKLPQIRGRTQAVGFKLKAAKQLKIHPKTPSRYPST